MISPADIVAIAPAARTYATELVRQMTAAGIQANANRASCFLGQIHVECAGFTRVVESLNYAADSAMMRKFIGWGRISASDARKFGRTSDHPANQSALANILYGGAFGARELGNVQPGDGWRFRGRGCKQLTGRDNYARFSEAWLGDDSLLDNPDRVAAPDGAVASAVWFWQSRPALNAAADRGDVEAVTRIVNGGTTALAERARWTTAYRSTWSPAADFSQVTSAVASTETPR